MNFNTLNNLKMKRKKRMSEEGIRNVKIKIDKSIYI